MAWNRKWPCSRFVKHFFGNAHAYSIMIQYWILNTYELFIIILLYIYTVSDKKIEPVHFCKKIAFWLFGFSLVKLRKIHFFTYQKILLSSRAFQISGFRQERVNRSGDMCSRRAFTHPTSEKLIAGLKLAIAIFNSVRVEGDRVCLPGFTFTGLFIPWEGRILSAAAIALRVLKNKQI